MCRWILKAANALLSGLVYIFLGAMGLYAAYALWDNSQVYAAAQNVQAEMLQYKPATEGEEGPSFQQLLALNPDICGWVTLDGTRIDQPILQGDTNLTYLNRDVYGNFALAGSIFLDTRNRRDFQDVYSLLYGHHMENGGMFGDLDLYKDGAFFAENRTGTLLLPEKTCSLEIFACLLADAGEKTLFAPEQWQTDIAGSVRFVRSNAMQLNEQTLRALEQVKQPRILALSTCATEFTDARTVVLAWIQEE